MHLRTTQRRNKDGSVVRYLALAENRRHPGKGHVEARVIHSFGREDQLDRAALQRLVGSLRRVLDEADASGEPAARGPLSIERVHELGIVHLARHLWQELGLGAAVGGLLERQGLSAPHAEALLAMVAQRLDAPGSKLACRERWLASVWLPEAWPVGLFQLYRAMDVLAAHGEALEAEAFWRTADLFRLEVDLVLFDSTTAPAPPFGGACCADGSAAGGWFEIEEEDESPDEEAAGLRRRGHSKEGRDNDPQVVIALAVTREGMPVRSWVFPGNTPDVTTMKRIKADLAAMRLSRVLLVGDAGHHSRDNLAELAKAGGRYVLATPVARLKEVREAVLARPGRYATITPALQAKEVVVGDGERRRRYVVCRNAEEAERQRHRREALLAALQAELTSLREAHPKAACKLLASRRFGPYLSQDADGRPVLDRAKVARAERLDGKFVLTSNDDTLAVADIVTAYQALTVIEASFRAMKTTGLQLRPMFPWTPPRIVAHVRLCVLALMLRRAAEIRAGLPWARIAARLRPLKAVTHTSEGRAITQATRLTGETVELLAKLQVPPPKALLAIG
jgi:hypothetical protein